MWCTNNDNYIWWPLSSYKASRELLVVNQLKIWPTFHSNSSNPLKISGALLKRSKKNIFCRIHKDLDHDIEKISAARYFPPFHHWPIANSKELILVAEHYCWLAKSRQIKQVYENSSNGNIRPIVVTWCHRHSLVTLTKP